MNEPGWWCDRDRGSMLAATDPSDREEFRVTTAPSVLVVEDDFLAAKGVATTLESQGFTVLGPVARVADAMTIIDGGRVDAAVLDIHLGKETAAPIATALVDRRCPFVFLTGYGDLTEHANRKRIRQRIRRIFMELAFLLPRY